MKYNLFIGLYLFSISIIGQMDDQVLSKLIMEKDSLFWTGYNTCNYGIMESLLAEDVEFYHDKGGIMMGLAAVMKATRENICGNPKQKLRREAVPGTLKIFPMKSGDKIYGAILSGDHYFYVKQIDQPEIREGLAKFTHLWLLKEDTWKMHRILSYDHGPAPYYNQRKAVNQPAAVLDQYTGKYEGQAGLCIINRIEDVLHLMIGKQKYILYPESPTRFFSMDRDLTFEFPINDKGKVSKMVVREKDKIVEEAVFKSKE